MAERTECGHASGLPANPARSEPPLGRVAFAVHPLGEVTVGSCATGSRESGQDREVAAFNGVARVPQIAWPSPHSAGVAAPGQLHGAVDQAGCADASGDLDELGLWTGPVP